MTDQLHRSIDEILRAIQSMQDDHDGKSFELLKIAASYRAVVLKNQLAGRFDGVVAAGPFAGMRMVENASEGCYLPKLLGGYESALAPYFHAMAAAPPDVILNIGCAEGYYAVGLARLMPSARVLAHDIDTNALRLCGQMAELNGVADRITLGGQVDGAVFAALAGQKVLVVCDIEGAEADLLAPDAVPALRGFTLVVEAHDEPDAPPVSDLLERRFAASHMVERATSLRRPIDLPAECLGLSEIDQLLLVWEGRGVPTPWLVMTPR